MADNGGEETTATATKSKRAKPSSKKKAEQAKRERTADSKAALQQRSSELLAAPCSAFLLFGFSQRGILKKQKSIAAVRDVVKAVGERWLLLSEEERRKYEEMAEEDRRRSLHAASVAEAHEDADAPTSDGDAREGREGDEQAEDTSFE